MDVDSPVARDVTMAVVDGIVFGPPVCNILALKTIAYFFIALCL